MKAESVLEGVKIALTTVAGIGISALCGTFCGGLTTKMKPIEKICAGFASAVMGGIAAEKAGEYIEGKVDSIYSTINAVSDVINQAREETKEEEKEHDQ